MRKKILTVLLTVVMTTSCLVGCGSNKSGGSTNAGDSSGSNVLEFYHGYFHEESEWPAAKVMRDIYDAFAKQHEGGDVTFKPIAVENYLEIMNNKVASGNFPDMIDLAGNPVSLAAITQGLVYDMKPYIDSENLKDAVGINYTQNDIDGSIYTVHDQLLTLGFWYNENLMKESNTELPQTWNNWDDFGKAMVTVRENGQDGNYAYGSGQGSIRCFNAYLGQVKPELLDKELSKEIIESKEFAEAFKTIATLDQENGSANAGSSANDFSADFSDGKSSVFFNGVWAAGGFAEKDNIKPAIFPGNVALSSAGGGLTIGSKMDEAKIELALEFVKYMTSEEVQKKIFLEVGANPCNSSLNINDLAKEKNDPTAILLAEACDQANNAKTIVKTIDSAWGGDIQTAIANKLIECSVAGVDIDAKFEALKSELVALIE